MGMENIMQFERLFIRTVFLIGPWLLVFRGFSILLNTWTTNTKKGTSKQNINQMSINLR